MNRGALSQRSVTVNLTKSLDAYLRKKARRERKSMNAIMNEALEAYREREER